MNPRLLFLIGGDEDEVLQLQLFEQFHDGEFVVGGDRFQYAAKQGAGF